MGVGSNFNNHSSHILLSSNNHLQPRNSLKQVKMSRDWNNGLFSCFKDMSTCCCVYLCGCCQIYNTAEHLGESGMLYFLLGCITPCIPIMMLRGKAREKYDIEGDTTNDALMACCCGCCSLIQTVNEVKEHGH